MGEGGSRPLLRVVGLLGRIKIFNIDILTEESCASVKVGVEIEYKSIINPVMAQF